ASFHEPGRQHSRTRCLVGRSHGGELTIWDSATGVTHLRADADPKHASDRIKQLGERLRDLPPSDGQEALHTYTRITPEDDFDTALRKALVAYAFCPENGNLPVVPIFGEGDGM